MTLIAVVAAVIGSVTAIAFHSYMYGKLDGQLRDISLMAEARPPAAADPHRASRWRGSRSTSSAGAGASPGAGLVAAGSCAAMVGVALRPLRRVVATATRVSELPLHSGEGAAARISSWVEETFEEVTVGSATFYDLTSPKDGE